VMRRHIEMGRRDTQYKWQALCQEKRAEDTKEIVCTIEAVNHPSPSAAAFAA
jgi:hypothetical protein